MRGARQLLTLRGHSEPGRGPALRELGIIEDGALLIQGGIIREVGPSRRIENLSAAQHAREIDATRRVVMPGFVDSHTHMVHGLSWLDEYDTLLQTRKPPDTLFQFCPEKHQIDDISARMLEFRARRAVDGMVRHGTTTLEAKTGYAGNPAGEFKVLRMLAGLHQNPLDVYSSFLAILPEGSDAADALCQEFLPRLRRRKLAHFADVYCDRPGCDVQQVMRYLDSAVKLGFRIKLHADHLSRIGGVRLAAGFDAVSADHLDCINENDISMLARSNTVATLLPGCTFHLGLERYAPARLLIDRGVAVALASDFNPASSPTYNMQMVISLACSQMGMTSAEAISAATINGAHALKAADKIGSLEPGKQADLIFLHASDYREIPYHFGVNQVSMVMKRGVTIYQEGAVQ